LKTAQKLPNVDSNNNDLKQKLAIFAHTGKIIGYIIKLFKQYTPICIQDQQFFKCNLSLQQTDHNTGKWLSGGVYKPTSLDCNKAHVGQTGRAYIHRFKESNNTAFFIHHYFNSRFSEQLSIIWSLFQQNGKQYAIPSL
jgi:hypothetical protein